MDTLTHEKTRITLPTARVAASILFSLLAVAGLSAALTDLDTSFDGDGKVFTGFAISNDPLGIGTDFGTAVAIQDDGKIVVGGQCRIMFQQDNFCLARYNANGSLDTIFDGDGKVETFMNVNSAGIAAVLIQSDDKIVAAGTCGVNGDFCVARYNVNGSLDTTFDTDGRSPHIDFGPGDPGGTSISSDNAYGAAIQSDGKIVVVGQCDPGQRGVGRFCVARLLSNGSLDTGFGGAAPDLSGTVVTQALDTGGARAVLLSGSSIIAAGNCAAFSSVDQNCLVKYTSTGGLDGGFGDEGIAIFYNGSFATSAAFHNGGIVLGGYCEFVVSDFCVARYSADGAPDLGFGNTVATDDNISRTDFGTGDEHGNAVAVLSDGSILVVGTCNFDFCLAFHTSDGTGNATQVVTPMGADTDSAHAVAVQPDGRIVVAGWCWVAGQREELCAARYGDAPVAPIVTTEIHNSTHGGITASTVGTAVHASVTVAPTGDPAGLVTVSWFTNGVCQEPAAAVSGPLTLTGGGVDATAFEQTPATAGLYAFRAHYAGDGLYGAADGPCAPLTVTDKLPATVTTAIHNPAHGTVLGVTVGTTVHDSVTVTGSGAAPTGTVILNWFTNGTCTVPAADTSGALSLTSGAIDATGFPQTPGAPGIYAFRAQYSGDDVYQSATGPCEQLTVIAKQTPTVDTQIHLHDTSSLPNAGTILVGQSVHAFVTVEGSGPQTTGTVTVSWFTNGSCRGRAAATSAPTPINDEGWIAVTSFVQTPTVKGQYAFQTTYAGDDNYTAAVSPCEPLNVVARLTPVVQTAIHQSEHLAITQIEVGEPVHNSVTLPRLNGLTPTGTVTVRFFQNGTCKGKAAGTSAATPLIPDLAFGHSAVDVTAFVRTLTTPGTYAFQTTYSGDASFAALTAPCQPLVVTPN